MSLRTLDTQDIAKTVLILTSPEFAKEVASTAKSFLESHHWKITITDQLKEALKTLLQEQPKFFIVSLHHPAKRLSVLLPLIASRLEVCLIPMIENLGPGPNTHLEKNFKSIVRPPLTGTAMEKGIYRALMQEMAADHLQLDESNYKAMARDMGIHSEVSAEGDTHLRLTQPLAIFAKGDENLPQLEIQELLANLDPAGVGEESLSTLALQNLDDGVERVLQEASIAGPVQKALHLASHVSCITVNSTRFSGYLITAQANRKRVDLGFLSLVKSRLQQFLRDRGENVAADEPMELELKEVAFEAWSAECAEFLKKSVHSGQEIAMAFFPFTRAKIMYTPMNAEDLVSVGITDVKEDETLSFDLYLFFPANGKYILYTPRGARFLASQKERLQRAGVKDLFVKQDELKSFDRYRAESHLNGQILEFQNRAKSRDENA